MKTIKINYFHFLLREMGFGYQQILAQRQFFRQMPKNTREKF
jgi:hypothetical protein